MTKEQEILDLLAEAYNKFIELNQRHNWDVHEFVHAIHQAQNIVLARTPNRNLDLPKL